MMRHGLCLSYKTSLYSLLLISVTLGCAVADERQDEQNTFHSANMDDIVILIGASYARSWPIRSLDGKTVVNRGIGGNQSFEMLGRFQEDVLDANPSIVIIWGFINDIFRSDSVDMGQALARTRSSISEMSQQATDQGIRVILATEVTVREPKGIRNLLASVVGHLLGKPSYQSYVNDHVIALNRWIREYADKHGIQVLDFEKVLANGSGERRSEFAADDGSHLTAAAYEALTAYTVGAIAETKTNDSQ